MAWTQPKHGTVQCDVYNHSLVIDRHCPTRMRDYALFCSSAEFYGDWYPFTAIYWNWEVATAPYVCYLWEKHTPLGSTVHIFLRRGKSGEW